MTPTGQKSTSAAAVSDLIQYVAAAPSSDWLKRHFLSVYSHSEVRGHSDLLAFAKFLTVVHHSCYKQGPDVGLKERVWGGGGGGGDSFLFFIPHSASTPRHHKGKHI